MTQPVERVAELLSARNAIDADIAALIGRPMTSGHLGEWLAARIFGIDLESSAVAAGIDGRFTSGAITGATVNVKWYLEREGLLDVASNRPDYYLVLMGPASPATSSRGSTRPWCIAAAYLFAGNRLLQELQDRGVRIGVATSVRRAQWHAAEIYPNGRNTIMSLSPEQQGMLRLFAPR